MNPKIFRCRCCGARISWNATSCPICNRLVSNDRSKRYITIGILSGVVIILLIVALLVSQQ